MSVDMRKHVVAGLVFGVIFTVLYLTVSVAVLLLVTAVFWFGASLFLF